MASPLPTLMSSFQEAYEQLLVRAPGPVFPKARQLYFRKYGLEASEQGQFRTFMLEEEIQETSDGAVRIRALAFAIVHWQASQTTLSHYATYLWERWALQVHDLALVEGNSWFRQGGAYARFSAAAVYERAAPTTLLSPSVDPDAPGADPDPSG